MKKTIIIGLLIMSGILLFSGVAYFYIGSKGLTTIEIITPDVDFGIIPFDNVLKVPVKIKNKGSRKLVINRISNSCNCLESNIIYPTIKPNCTIEIPIEIKPRSSGLYFEKVFIFCNTPDSPIPITIKGELINK